MMEKNRHGLCIFVENEFGVIQRVTNLFSARGMNIETIHTTPIDDKSNISQISISLFENKKNIELIQSLLERLIVVHGVMHFINLGNESYCSQIINIKVNEIKGVLTKYELKVFNFNIYSNSEIYCIIGRNSELNKFLLEVQNFVNIAISKNYEVF